MFGFVMGLVCYQLWVCLLVVVCYFVVVASCSVC